MIPVFVSMVCYGLLHSVLASDKVKQRFQVKFGERAYHGLYRVVFNMIAFTTILPILYMMTLNPERVIWTIPLDYEPILWVIQGIGIIGFVMALLQIDGLRFLGLRQAWAYFNGDPLPLPDEKLTTTGVYKLVRHPLYLFSLMLIWPVTTMTEAYLGWALGVTLYFLVGSLYEERRMLQYYGEAYQAYRRNVPWLIPFLKFNNKS
ncbi:MAG: isoprenylcysteine carboxylmethyltransferase family protein [Chloroflexi bacterium]|nr:MAG: isoprenylcysteine carboxylmethyltransferase family protein [Chloroflexota bacterium]